VEGSGRVKHRKDKTIVHLEGARTDLRDADTFSEESLGCVVAKGTENSRFDDLYLFIQVWLTGLDLYGGWSAILRGFTLVYIGDVDIFSPDTDRLEEFAEQFSCRSDEWDPLGILVISRRFPDEYDICIASTGAKDHLGAAIRQRAELTLLHLVVKVVQMGGLIASCGMSITFHDMSPLSVLQPNKGGSSGYFCIIKQLLDGVNGFVQA